MHAVSICLTYTEFMKISVRALAILAAGVALLTGCSGTSTDGNAEGSEVVEAISETTEAAEPLSPGEDMTIECADVDSNATGSFTNLAAAWEVPREDRVSCDVAFGVGDSLDTDSPGFESYTLTDIEQEALESANYEDDPENIRYLYNICAESDMGDYEEFMPWSEDQNQEAAGALVLCPDHPDRGTVEKRMKTGNEEDAARERGEVFNDGTYMVGDDIQPGTYVSESEEPLEGCYWERVDVSGDTIENNFVSSGFRVEVTISASDYSFTAKRCGEWKKQ